jgi:protein-S-isoprenylcysteine O-methyltransferase Ste14
MGIAAGFIVLLSGAASWLGPHVSGLLSPLPIAATIFAVFAHKLQGGKPARQILHGVIVSSFACAVFFLVMAAWISPRGLVAALSGATAGALFTQRAMLWLVRRYALPPPTEMPLERALIK